MREITVLQKANGPTDHTPMDGSQNYYILSSPGLQSPPPEELRQTSHHEPAFSAQNPTKWLVGIEVLE